MGHASTATERPRRQAKPQRKKQPVLSHRPLPLLGSNQDSPDPESSRPGSSVAINGTYAGTLISAPNSDGCFTISGHRLTPCVSR
jgi:hypothetical protein